MKLKFLRVPDKYKNPFIINGLKGDILIAKSAKQQNILYVGNLVTGFGLSWRLINYLQSFGTVTSIDLPGIGGMDSFQSIDKKISLNNYADFLVSVIKSRYKNKKFIIFADGFGLVLITKLLLKYPKISSQIKIIICINGILSGDLYNKPSFSSNIYGNYFQMKKMFINQSTHSSFNKIYRLYPYYNLDINDPALNLYKSDKKYIKRYIESNDFYTNLLINKQLANLDLNGRIENVQLWNIQLKNSSIDILKTDESIRNIYSKYNKSSPKLNMIDIIFDTNISISNLFTLRLRKKLSK